MLKTSNFFILTLLFLEMTSCCRPNCSDQGNIEIPCTWQSPITEEMTLEDPSCFLWWEAFNDPILTSLIMEAANRNQDVLIASLKSNNILLKTMNDVSAEIAKNYMQFRGLQMRLKILNENIKVQREILTLNKELSNKGFFGVEKENEDQKNLESLLIQQPLIHFSMKKIILHLSTLVSYPPRILNETLSQSQDLPDLIWNNPVGYPSDLICHDPSVKEARKQYKASGTKQSLYSYQKVVLETLESAETALAAFNYERDKIQYLESAKNLKTELYQLAKDLNSQGLKDDRDVLLAYQELLSAENALIQGKVDLLFNYINLYQAISCAWEVCCNCQ